jgi:hypothetical protein
MTITAAIIETNHDREARIAETHGHTFGCFEELAELVVENLPAGVTYETGAFTEEIAGLTVLERMILMLIEKPSVCSCDENAERWG